jgi:hypothetical protein
MWDLLDSAANSFPDRIVVADEHGRTLTVAELQSAAEERRRRRVLV